MVAGGRARSDTEDRATATVRLHVLGPVRLDVAGSGAVHVPARLATLLGYLALHASGGRRVGRADVAYRLWPDQPEDRARRALTDALYRLERSTPKGSGWLSVDRASIALGRVWLDLDAFAALARSADPADWSAAIDLYGGELLEGVDDDWVDLPRAELHDRLVRLIRRVAEDRETAGDLAGALAWARRWAATDPLDEEAHRAVMRLYARLDRHAAALDHYDGLVALLASELDVEPGSDSRELAQHIRSELDLAGRSTSGGDATPLIGRDVERARLLQRLDLAAAGEGGLLVVLGEAGIGKSRLLREVEVAADWRGWQVDWGRGEEFGLPAPFAPLSDALRATLSPPRREQLRQLIEPAWLSLAAALIPELVGPGPPPRGRSSIRDLAAGIENVLRGLGRITPQLFLLDDVQWADEALWPLLEVLRPALGRMPVLIVVSGRSEDLRAKPEAWSQIQSWDRAAVPLVHLVGLGADALSDLSVEHDGRSLTSRELADLAAASGGNPLLALALLQSGEIGGPTPSAVVVTDPRSNLARLFDHRLEGLSAAARQALEAAAVVGQRFPYVLWQEVAGDLPLPALVGELERSRLLQLDGNGYAFAHDTLRSLVVWSLSADRRHELNRAALDARTRRTPDEALVLLFHAEQIGARAEIAEHAQKAGEQALAGLSFEAAARYFGRALDVLPSDDRVARYRALHGRAQALDVLADRERQRADLSELEDLALRIGGSARRIEAAIQLASFHWAVGEYADGAAVARRALGLARREGDASGQAALLIVSGRILREQGRFEEARTALERAKHLYGEVDDASGAALALELLGGVAWRLGDHRAAARQHAEAAELFERSGDLRLAAHSLNSLGSALWSLGDYEGARSVHERSLATCRELGDRRGEANNLDNLGGVAWVLGDYPRAIELYSQALAIRRESVDPWGIAISLSNLGDTYALTGDWAAALASYDEALEVDRTVGVRRNEATALQGKGRTLLEAGRLAEARVALETAEAIHLQVGDRDNLLDTRAALAMVDLALGDRSRARTLIDEDLAALEPGDRAALRQMVYYAAWSVLHGLGDEAAALANLGLAGAALEELTATIPPDALAGFAAVPVNRRTHEACSSMARRVVVSLARADVPLGRTVTEADRTPVTWTLAEPTDDVVADATERRRRILRRLLREADEQGASATDDDVAVALGVSRRTILRDIESLGRRGQSAPTRRRSRTAAPPHA